LSPSQFLWEARHRESSHPYCYGRARTSLDRHSQRRDRSSRPDRSRRHRLPSPNADAHHAHTVSGERPFTRDQEIPLAEEGISENAESALSEAGLDREIPPIAAVPSKIRRKSLRGRESKDPGTAGSLKEAALLWRFCAQIVGASSGRSLPGFDRTYWRPRREILAGPRSAIEPPRSPPR